MVLRKKREMVHDLWTEDCRDMVSKLHPHDWHLIGSIGVGITPLFTVFRGLYRKPGIRRLSFKAFLPTQLGGRLLRAWEGQGSALSEGS